VTTDKPINVVVKSIPIAISTLSYEFLESISFDTRNAIYERLSAVLEEIIIYSIKYGELP